MKFYKLAEYFEQLESTSKRLELVDILSRLFKEAKTEEIGEICYLIQGRVAPFFEPIEIGMAESMIAQAVARAYGPTSPRLRGVKNLKDEVIKLYRTTGNFGIAASLLATKVKSPAFAEASTLRSIATAEDGSTGRQKSKVSVTEVFNDLLKIAKFSGEGTVEKKVLTLADLLRRLDPISVKHVVNIPLGTLRLGIGDPTVLDALSFSKKGDKSLRPILEDAYNKTSDLGYVAEIFFKKGESGLKNLKLIIGKPIRPALAERLPNVDEAVKRLGHEFAAEPKFDGFRVAVHKNGNDVSLFSRNLENTTHAFPDVVEGVKKEVRAKSAILEGEAIAYNPTTQEFLPFQETTRRRRKYNIEEKVKELPLVLFAFDLLYLNGKDITEKPYRERRKLLESIINKDLPARSGLSSGLRSESSVLMRSKTGKAGGKVVRLAEERVLHKADDITKFFNEAVSEGLEGLMLKKLDSPYVAGGRGFHWIKFKRAQSGELTDTVDCVLLGVYAGRGKRTEFGVGGLLVGVYDDKQDEFVTISRIGTGLTDEEFRKVNDLAKRLKVSNKPSRVNSKVEPTIWLEPKVVLEVYADEITRSPVHTAGWDEKTESGFALRFPRLVKFREKDKRPEDATTVEEVEKMYHQQFKKRR